MSAMMYAMTMSLDLDVACKSFYQRNIMYQAQILDCKLTHEFNGCRVSIAYENDILNCDGEIDDLNGVDEDIELCKDTFPSSAVISCQQFSYFTGEEHIGIPYDRMMPNAWESSNYIIYIHRV